MVTQRPEPESPAPGGCTGILLAALGCEQLALLRSDRGMFLAWVKCDDVIEPEDTEKLEEQLGL